jgi:formate/nitrite transporter FocA (FNT family)
MPKQVRHDVLFVLLSFRHVILNLFQDPSGQATLHGNFLACGMPKQVRHDLLFVLLSPRHVILNLFQDPSGQATLHGDAEISSA